MMYFLIERPSVMEDEGRYLLVGWFTTLSEAKTARDQRVKESKGWFRENSFVIAQDIQHA